MQTKPLYAALVAAAFALPIAANANTGTAGAKSASDQAASTSASNGGGAEAMFKSLDKNGDGFISKDEIAGSPHAVDFASLDRNGDGKLSREEHANANEHVAARAKAGGTASSSSDKTSSTKTY